MEEQAKEVAQVFKVLSNEKRLLIMCALFDGPLTVNEIAERVPGISLPGISQHLTALRNAGVISSEKHGQHVVCSIADPRFEALFDVVKREFCTLH